MPRLPFIGELDYGDISRILRQQRRWFTRAERQVIDDLDNYLAFKRATVPDRFPAGGPLPHRWQHGRSDW